MSYKPLMPVYFETTCFICECPFVSFTEETGGYNYVCSVGHNNLLPVKNKTVTYTEAMFYSADKNNKPVPKILAGSAVSRIQGDNPLRIMELYFPMCGVTWKYASEAAMQREIDHINAELCSLGLL